jgi:HK97 gp10 family phage protein
MDELQAKLKQVQKDLTGPEMVEGMRKATLFITYAAKGLVPVDTGRLRASITPAVETQGDTVTGIVGSNVVYAPFVEMGTKPHWAPFRAFQVWAPRHGMGEAEVWWAVGLRGTKAHPYLKPAIEQNVDKIVSILDEAVARAVEK